MCKNKNNNHKIASIIFWSGITFFFITVIFLVVIYRQEFYGELSEDLSDWANTGSFFYSILTIILTLLNIFLFYELTAAANEINGKSQKTSDGIIGAFTTAETNRTNYSICIDLFSKYTEAHRDLILCLHDNTSNAASMCQQSAQRLLSIFKIVQESKQFTQTNTYIDKVTYIKLLNSISDNAQKELQQNDQDIHATDLTQFNNYNFSFNEDEIQLSQHYKSISDLMVTDINEITK